jgi:hypothetical protein
MPLYKFLHNLLNVLEQIANKIRLQTTEIQAAELLSNASVHMRTTDNKISNAGGLFILIVFI